MLIVHVHVHVKPESVEEFRQATIENARASVQEPGIARFDVMQLEDEAHVMPFGDGQHLRQLGRCAPANSGNLMCRQNRR